MSTLEELERRVERLEGFTGTNLIIMYGETSHKYFESTPEHQINREDVRALAYLLHYKENKTSEINIMLQTNGGHLDASIQIIEILRKFYQKLNFIVSTSALSAGSYQCCCGNMIYLGERAFLSDFRPSNYANGNPIQIVDQLHGLSNAYKFMDHQLREGLMGTYSNFENLFFEMAAPLFRDKSVKHGNPILKGKIEKMFPNHVKGLWDIPAPNLDPSYGIGDSFLKVDRLVRKIMREKDLAKLMYFGGKGFNREFVREHR